MKTEAAHAAVERDSEFHDYRPLFPFATLKCIGRAVFRSAEARGYACLLDIDPEVVSWQSCQYPITDLGKSRGYYHIDLEVQTTTESLMVEVCDSVGEPPHWLLPTLDECGYRFLMVRASDLNPVRVSNARDLMRYARYDAALGDRIRVLAALDEMGTLTLAESLATVREGRAMETISALILRGHISVNLDDDLLGPDTIVRRAAK